MDKIQLGNDINILQIGNDFQISGLLFSGHGQSFVVCLPHKTDDVYEPIRQMDLTSDRFVEFIRQLDLLETEGVVSNNGGEFTKGIVRKSQRQIDTFIQWQVFQRDRYSCRYCGRTGIPLSVDHIILWEEGGPTIEDNLISACKSCNRDRGNTDYRTWISSKDYLSKSKNLTESQKNANLAVALDLPRLESLKISNVRSR